MLNFIDFSDYLFHLTYVCNAECVSVDVHGRGRGLWNRSRGKCVGDGNWAEPGTGWWGAGNFGGRHNVVGGRQELGLQSHNVTCHAFMLIIFPTLPTNAPTHHQPVDP